MKKRWLYLLTSPLNGLLNLIIALVIVGVIL